jgi:hypothetical protein
MIATMRGPLPPAVITAIGSMLESLRELNQLAAPAPETAAPGEFAEKAGHLAVMAAHVVNRFDQLADGVNAVTINLDPGKRESDNHKIKIVAVEPSVVGYVRYGAIQRGRGDGSRQISMLL